MRTFTPAHVTARLLALAALAAAFSGCASQTHYGKKTYNSVEYFKRVDHSFGVVLEQEPKDNGPKN